MEQHEPPGNGCTLEEQHLAELHASGISAEMISASRIRSVSDREARRYLNWSEAGPNGRSMAGWMVPFYREGETTRCFCQIKPDTPRQNKNGKPVKYENPRGKVLHAYFPPGCMDKIRDTGRVIITEGPKKALAAMTAGFACIALVGVYGFQRKRPRTDAGTAYGKCHLVPDLAALEWKPSEVTIVFDSDAAENDLVRLAAYRLAELLKQAGAKIVKLVFLPTEDGEKVGLDDFLVRNGAGELRKVVAEAGPAEEPEPPTVMEWAKMFLADRYSTLKGITIRWFHDEFYEWDGVRYVKRPTSELTACAQKWLDEHGANATPRRAGDVTKSLCPLCMVSGQNDLPTFLHDCYDADPKNIIAFKNGLLDITNIGGDVTILDHNPNWFSTGALEYDFDPKAKCPEWMQFLHETLGNDELIDLLHRFFGLCLVPDTSYQKLLMLLGPRRSGKGTICRLLQHVVGPDQCTSPSLGSLSGDFGLWPLENKTVAIFADAHLGRRSDSTRILEVIKSIVGEDAVNINRKNLPYLLNVRLATRFIITVNELPHFSDVSGAFVSRLLVIPFKKSFADCMDRTLEQRLRAEASGILNWALRGLFRLREAGVFNTPEASKAILGSYERMTSPVSAFLQDCCDTGGDKCVACERLYRCWREWCRENGHQAGTSARFGERVGVVHPSIVKGRPRIDDRRVYTYFGLGLNEHGEHLWQSHQTREFGS